MCKMQNLDETHRWRAEHCGHFLLAIMGLLSLFLMAKFELLEYMAANDLWGTLLMSLLLSKLGAFLGQLCIHTVLWCPFALLLALLALS